MNCFVFFILHKIRCIFCSRCLLELKGVRNDVKWSGFYFALIWRRKYKNCEESIFLVFFSTHFFFFFDKEKFVTITFTCRSSFLCLKILLCKVTWIARKVTRLYLCILNIVFCELSFLVSPLLNSIIQKINNEIWNFLCISEFQLNSYFLMFCRINNTT